MKSGMKHHFDRLLLLMLAALEARSALRRFGRGVR